MKQVLRIAKENYDAKTAPPDKLLLNSDQECIKINSKIVDSITIPNLIYNRTDGGWSVWSGYKDYYHNLGFVPVFRFFTNQGNNTITEAPYFSTFPESESNPFNTWGYSVYCFVDDQKVRIQADVIYTRINVPQTVLNYILFIFANPLDIQPLPRVSSEGPWLDVVYGDITLGTNFSQLTSPGIIIDSNYGDLSFGG